MVKQVKPRNATRILESKNVQKRIQVTGKWSSSSWGLVTIHLDFGARVGTLTKHGQQKVLHLASFVGAIVPYLPILPWMVRVEEGHRPTSDTTFCGCGCGPSLVRFTYIIDNDFK